MASGLTVKHFKVRGSADDRITVHQWEAVEHTWPNHSHPEYKLGVSEGGTGTFFYRGQRYFTGPGKLLVIHPNEVHSCTASLAQLTKGIAVTVNTVMPGSTLTPGVKEFVSNLFPDEPYDSAEKRFMADNRPTSLIQRLVQPEEIANMVAFVASPLASTINGAPIRVDGGLIPTIA